MPSEIEKNISMEEKLEYLGLNLGKIPVGLKKFEPLEFRIPKFYEEKQCRQYRYIPVKDIQILLSPTNRLDELEERYRKASPLADYLDSKTEKNILKYTTFLSMLKKVKIEEIEQIEQEQENLAKKIPFKVKFEGNYLWQIYYAQNTDQYFMLVPTEDVNYSAFFFLLKKQLERKRTTKIFVPVMNAEYSREYLKKAQFADIENYLWLFTNNWPYVYEVYDKNDELSIQIVGETEVYEKIRSPYRIKLNNKEEVKRFYRLLKAMFILQTELPHYFTFKTDIGKKGEIEFYIEDRKIEYDTIAEWINDECKRGKGRIQEVKELIKINKKKLERIKEEIGLQEIEYLAKEKQISTFLECKKSFFGKFKYYFKYSKKKNKEEIQSEEPEEAEIEAIEENSSETKDEMMRKRRRREALDKGNYTIEELVDIYKEFEKLEYVIKNIMLDLNSLKLKKKNMEKKIENATRFIEEIDSHKKSIFEFWKYSNKDAIATLPEGEEEEVNIIKKITKVFDYEEDLEKFGIAMDKIQRKALSQQETDSVFIATTNLIDIMNRVKNNKVVPKDITASLRELKKEALEEEALIENEEFDIFGGITQDKSKLSKIKNKRHREIPKDKFVILDITKSMKQIGYKLSLENVIENIKIALKKVTLCDDVPVYKAIQDELLDEKQINVFDMNPEAEIKETINKGKDIINFYKINLKRGVNAISFTNSIFYDNQNGTLPIGQDLSTKMIVDISKINMELKKKDFFQIVDLEKGNDFSDVTIKTIQVYEYEAELN
ncbi:MAG: hypothetical protein HFJ35_05400 [Clostridia bacterium]|nr:hypothetical protein [Clostridia bacterium]